ncbi:MAG TPA: ABC transporter ATP-binding protein [Myxococcaceae bacterium]
MIRLERVEKVYRRGKTAICALQIDALEVPRGQFLTVMGPSGSGKSTLLYLLGALDVPTSGSIVIDGTAISAARDAELSRFRRERLGFVFQFFNLLPTLTALENVLLPGLLAGHSREVLSKRAGELMEIVGLKARADHRPDELSGGEMQRVAVARALLIKPALLLADEPTGNLDSKTGAEVLKLIREATRQAGVTVVMVTHDPGAAKVGDRVVRLADGKLAGDEAVAAA